jgi:DNA helicase II / ATP-dependent DNA helicase PcrA
MAYDYLADLNWEQRRAVKHGVNDGSAIDSKPLLVIAGAGTGKTKTLAHRVAHLVVNGIDPQRILLLTFSRRAALDMTRRVKRITSAAIGIGEIELPWAGTFHAVGVRILREFASRIGLKPSFTILDRSDAADLMDVVRHDLGVEKGIQVSEEGHLPGNLLPSDQLRSVHQSDLTEPISVVHRMEG